MPLSYKVTVIATEGTETTFDGADDVTIIDKAEVEGVDADYSCRAGSGTACAGNIIDSTVNQEEQSFLDEDQMEAGFVLTCVAYPTSDCKIQLGEEENII